MNDMDEEMDRTLLIILCGKSGAGKDYCAKELAKQFKSIGYSVNDIVSCTTRPKREGEVEGKDYFFLSDEQFQTGLVRDDFLEYSKFRGWYYGIPKDSIAKNKINILVMNPEGVISILQKNNLLPDNTTGIILYIDVPFRIRLLRSIKREGRFKIEFLRRAITDSKDFKNFLYNYDHSASFGYQEFYASKINGLPPEDICDRIMEKISLVA